MEGGKGTTSKVVKFQLCPVAGEVSAPDAPATSRIVAHSTWTPSTPPWRSAGTPLSAAPHRRRGRSESGRGPGVVTTASYAATEVRHPVRACRSRARGASRGGPAPRRAGSRIRPRRPRASTARCPAASWPSPLAVPTPSRRRASTRPLLDLSSLGDFERAAAHARALKAESSRARASPARSGSAPTSSLPRSPRTSSKPDGLTVVRPEAVRDSSTPSRSGASPASARRAAPFTSGGIRPSPSCAPSSGRTSRPGSEGGIEHGRAGARHLREPGHQRVGAQVGRRAGDLRAEHPRRRPSSWHGATRSPRTCSPAAGRWLPRVPDASPSPCGSRTS